MLVFYPDRKNILYFKISSGEENHSSLVYKQEFLPARPQEVFV